MEKYYHERTLLDQDKEKARYLKLKNIMKVMLRNQI